MANKKFQKEKQISEAQKLRNISWWRSVVIVCRRGILTLMLIGITMAALNQLLLVPSNSWFVYLFSILIGAVCYISLLLMMVIVIFRNTIAKVFFDELDKKLENKVNFSNRSLIIRYALTADFSYTPSLVELVRSYVEYDRYIQSLPALKQAEIERQWHKGANETLQNSLQNFDFTPAMTRRILKALRSPHMHVITKKVLMLNVAEVIKQEEAKKLTIDNQHRDCPTQHQIVLDLQKPEVRLKKAAESKKRKRATSKVSKIQHNAVALEKPLTIFDDETKCLVWENIPDFDISLIPTQFESACAHVLYALAHQNLGSTTFKHRAVTLRQLTQWIQFTDPNTSIAQVLMFLEARGVIRKSVDHHDYKRGKEYYKINLSPEGIGKSFLPLQEKLIEAFTSKP